MNSVIVWPGMPEVTQTASFSTGAPMAAAFQMALDTLPQPVLTKEEEDEKVLVDE